MKIEEQESQVNHKQLEDVDHSEEKEKVNLTEIEIEKEDGKCLIKYLNKFGVKGKSEKLENIKKYFTNEKISNP